MNREIKFRGITVETNQWIYGDLVHNVFDGTSRELHIAIKQNGMHSLAVKPESVGMFTNLYDSNRTPIYEKDILKSWYSRDMSGKDIVHTQQVVEFELKQWEGNSGYEILFIERCEIIGNTYENPELIKN